MAGLAVGPPENPKSGRGETHSKTPRAPNLQQLGIVVIGGESIDNAAHGTVKSPVFPHPLLNGRLI